MNTMNDCKICRSSLPDLLLEPTFRAAHPELDAHLRACVDCRTELEEMQATFALLDTWTAPEPSAFFDARVKARVREAASQPENFLERAKAWWMYSTGRSMKPALASALALVLVAAGGGTFAGLHGRTTQQPQASATVNDLKMLDNNAEALQQMDQLLDASNDDGTEESSPTS
jgi:hypothetical protein